MNHPNTYSPDEHQEIALLLPWYVNRSLDTDEDARVRRHLQHCLACRRELAALHSVADAVAAAPTLDFSARSSYARFMRQLPSRPGASSPTAEAVTRRWNRRHFWPGVYAVAAAILLLVLPLGIRQYSELFRPDFQTLSDSPTMPPRPAGDLRLVFSKDLPEARIDALLREVGAKIVDGPNAAGAYALRLGEGGKPVDTASALAFLRRQEGVLLAEPILQDRGEVR